MKVVQAQQMQALDREAIQDYQIPGIVLMENAGLRVIAAMEEHFENFDTARILIVCSKGNNGGDGFVVARHLHNFGHPIELYLLADPSGLKGDALTNYQIAQNMSIPMQVIDSIDTFKHLESSFRTYDILVDAVFGTGLSSAPRGHYAHIIREMNNSGIPVVAIDIPSGLHPDSGVPYEPCIEAELTITFGLPKWGQVLYPGALYCGQLVVGDISFPSELLDKKEFQVSLLDDPDLLIPLLNRRLDSHKGTFGHLLAVAGSVGKTGAAFLLAEGALRMGTGLVTVGIPSSLNDVLEIKLSEVMTEPLPETPERTLSQEACARILDLCAAMSAVALGPGLSQHVETKNAIRTLVQEITVPLVIDADGLNALAGNLELLLKRKNESTVLTPHPGEMARLMDLKTADIQKQRIEVAQELARRTECIVVLKGARSIIAAPDGTIEINLSGNPGMASGGTGDVLTGIIGALLAQNFSAHDAARMGTYIHGLAADKAVEIVGDIPLTASDIISSISKVLVSSNQD